MTSIGLGRLARWRARFLKLTLNGNRNLLEDLVTTRLFVENVLLSDEMSLLELHINDCGEHAAAIIQACENDNCKLQVLDVSTCSRNHLPLILDQAFESIPKMKSLKKLICDKLFTIRPHHPWMMTAIHKNTSIVELKFDSIVNSSHRHSINSIMIRNQCLTHAETLLALQPSTHMPIRSKSGIWYMSFAELGAQLYRPRVNDSDDEYDGPEDYFYDDDDDDSDDDTDDDDDDDGDDETGASSESTASSFSSVEERRSEENGRRPGEGRLPDMRPPPVERRIPHDARLPDIRLLGERPMPDYEESDMDNIWRWRYLQGAYCMAYEFPGTSAIFNILRTRPPILEKQQRRPVRNVVLARGRGQTDVAPQDQQPVTAPIMRNDDGGGDDSHLQDANADAGGRKRRRL
jgi:hypothetical protein